MAQRRLILVVLIAPMLAPQALAEQVHVDVGDNFFSVLSAVPGQGTAHCTIQPGDQVVWHWEIGFNPHSVTADDASFDSGVLFPPDTYEHTFGAAGTFPYHCILHGGHHGAGMSGSITVADPPGCPGERGDADCNGLINFFDIDPFLLALFTPQAYADGFCSGDICAADVDCSGAVNFFDIDPFLNCLFATCPACPG